MAGPASAQLPICFLKVSQPPCESMKVWAWDSVMQTKLLGETASQLQPHRSYEQVIVSWAAPLLVGSPAAAKVLVENKGGDGDGDGGGGDGDGGGCGDG